jgi:hypothetical protein
LDEQGREMPVNEQGEIILAGPNNGKADRSQLAETLA